MYKAISEYPKYLVSEIGEIWSEYSNKNISTYLNGKGYLCVKLHDKGTQKTFGVHRLVARVWGSLPSLDSPLEVHHKDNNKLNCAIDNLEVLSTDKHRDITYKTLGWEKNTSKCKECGCNIRKGSNMCVEHTSSNKPKTNVTSEQIEYWVKHYSWVRAAKELGYSDNGLRKRYKSLTGKDPKSITQS